MDKCLNYIRSTWLSVSANVVRVTWPNSLKIRWYNCRKVWLIAPFIRATIENKTRIFFPRSCRVFPFLVPHPQQNDKVKSKGIGQIKGSTPWIRGTCINRNLPTALAMMIMRAIMLEFDVESRLQSFFMYWTWVSLRISIGEWKHHHLTASTLQCSAMQSHWLRPLFPLLEQIHNSAAIVLRGDVPLTSLSTSANLNGSE